MNLKLSAINFSVINFSVVIIFFILLSAIVLFISPVLGMGEVNYGSLFDISSNDGKILWKMMLPRSLLAYIVGAGLAVGGMVFQAIFRNPLASPFTLGVASGASFGVALYTKIGVVISLAIIDGVSLFAFIGALGAISLVFLFSRIKRNNSTYTMLLSGVAISFFFSSLILFIQYASDHTESYKIIRWLMGGLETIGYCQFLSILPMVFIGLVVIALFINELNIISLGDDFALSRGVHTLKIKVILFFMVSIMIGAIVSVCGPIGFVGMIVPHISRLLVGANHRKLFWVTLMFGGVFLVICDLISIMVLSPAELPIGVITALLGGPFFLWLLLSRRA